MNGPLKRWTGRMTLRSDENPVDRLADDRELELLLRAEASRLERRAGLADRIFAASVGQLPARQRPVRTPWMLRPGRLTLGSMWGRLAMAASIGLAFFVGLRTLPPTAAVWPLLSTEAELVLLEFAGASYDIFGDSAFVEVEHLLVTRDMTFRDLTSDLAALADDLEM